MEIQQYPIKKEDYLDFINRVIEEETLKYAVPVYNYNYLKNYCNYRDILFIIESDTFLENITHANSRRKFVLKVCLKIKIMV